MSSIRVLICEDSRTYAAVLQRALEHEGDIEVVATASSAEQAIATLQNESVDVVTMDLELPGMDGIAAIEQIMGSTPCPILVLSSHLGSTALRTASALAAGALDAVSKDGLDLLSPDSPSASSLRSRLRQLSKVPVIRHPRSRLRPRERISESATRATVIGICSSTGGPQALSAVLSRIPSTFQVPILVVQHISPGFTEGLARWLDTVIPLPVELAVPGNRLTPGVVIAPEGAHLTVGQDSRLVADRSAPRGFHQPSGDVLLASLAQVAKDHSVAVVLSGMGKDGASGAKDVRTAGGVVLAQDEESCAVYGMPKAAVEEAGATTMTPEEIGVFLSRLIAEPLAK